MQAGVGAPFVNIDGLTFSLEEGEPDPSFTFLTPSSANDQRLLQTIEDLKVRCVFLACLPYLNLV